MMSLPTVLIDALADQLFRKIDDVSENERLKEDLGFDSLTIVSLLVDIEERLGVEFDIDDLDPNKLLCVKDLVELINKPKGR